MAQGWLVKIWKDKPTLNSISIYHHKAVLGVYSLMAQQQQCSAWVSFKQLPLPLAHTPVTYNRHTNTTLLDTHVSLWKQHRNELLMFKRYSSLYSSAAVSGGTMFNYNTASVWGETHSMIRKRLKTTNERVIRVRERGRENERDEKLWQFPF